MSPRCRLCFTLSVLAVIVLASSSPARAADARFYVAPDGRDAWSGRVAAANADRTDGPFATLARARDAVRGLLKTQPQDVAVLVRGGAYRLTETVVFGLEDSPGPEHRVRYEAYPGETPVFTSGVPITKWRKLGATLPGLPEAARGKVWVGDVSHVRAIKERRGVEDWRFYTLYDAGCRLPRARSAGFDPTKKSKDRRGRDQSVLHFPKGAVKNWPNLRDVEIVIIPCSFWVMNILPLAAVNEAAGVATTTVPGTYGLTRNGMTDRPSVWVENIVDALDEPGEWVLDSENACVYYWPEGGRPGDSVAAPSLTELVRVEGRIDYKGPKDEPVRNLTFRGLAFTQGDRFPWHGRSGWGLQHDWEMFDRPTALVRLRGAEGCAIEDCRFTHSGHTAVRLDLHCQRNRVVGNHIDRMGGVGVLLAGYGPGTKDVNKGNVVANNYVHHIGETYWGSAAIFAWQSGGNRIAHNHIHHVPYTGIVVSGRIGWDRRGMGECSRTVRWHEVEDFVAKPPRRKPWRLREPYLHGRGNVVERNDIHHAMEVLGDGNCIYVSGTGTGNVVRENYCHDCDGRYMNAVIRCDDDQHGTTIERNVMCRTRGHGEGVITKGENHVLNNVIADLRPHGSHRGYICLVTGAPKGSMIQGNILYSRRKGQLLYLQNRAQRKGRPVPRLRDTDADGNLYFCTEDPDWAKSHFETERAFGIEGHSAAVDPMFVDVDAGDFRFKAGSPAAAMGIQPLEPSIAGLEPAYAERLIGPRARTSISPRGHVLWQPAKVTLSTDAAGGQIRYTLDGSEPMEGSQLYTAPFVIERGGMVRARTFAPGAVDLVGASAWFASAPQPIIEDFESVPLGGTTPNASTQEEGHRFTARVTDEQAASGQRSLKFVDGPGQKHPFNPHVFYRTRFAADEMVGRFAVRIDANTSFYYQWRQYGAGFVRGPTVQILPQGKLVHEGKELMALPTGEWVRFEVRCGMGEKRTGAFDMRVECLATGEVSTFPGLGYEPKFRRLDWVGFVLNGQAETVVYVDDVEVNALR